MRTMCFAVISAKIQEPVISGVDKFAPVGVEEDEDEKLNYHLGCMFLVFRIAHGSFGDNSHCDFALVRCLKLACREMFGIVEFVALEVVPPWVMPQDLLPRERYPW